MSTSEETGWNEVRDAASRMFYVWDCGGELAWAEEAWAHLYEAGLANDGSILEHTAAKLRLVTLARVYEEFSGLAWDENPETPLDYLAEDLDIDNLALGILAASAGGDFEDTADEYELRELALLAVTNRQRREVFECLSAAYGGAINLYTRLWKTRSPDQGEDCDGEEFEPTPRKANAMHFVTSGFQQG